jgi:hypothetical protein
MQLRVDESYHESDRSLQLFPEEGCPWVAAPEYDEFITSLLRRLSEVPGVSVAPYALRDLYDEARGVSVRLPEAELVIRWDLIGFWQVDIRGGSVPSAAKFFQDIAGAE